MSLLGKQILQQYHSFRESSRTHTSSALKNMHPPFILELSTLATAQIPYAVISTLATEPHRAQ